MSRPTSWDADGASADTADFGIKATTTDGITVTATESATINAITFAASAAAGFGVDAGIAVSGAGADANNIILYRHPCLRAGQRAQQFRQGRRGGHRHGGHQRHRDQRVVRGWPPGIAGVGASIGVAMARNYIGFEPDYSAASTYTTGSDPATIATNETVKIAAGAGAGKRLQIHRQRGARETHWTARRPKTTTG